VSDLRLGLVGCGRLAERGWLPAVARTAGVRLAAVADPVRSRCERLAPGIPAYESAAELIAAGAADALVLATPASAHLADARLAANAGLAVLVEKPPAADAAEAEALAGLQPPPWIGFNRRFDPSLRRLLARLPGRGRLELVLEQHRPAGAWEAYVVSDDALLSLGPHLIDLARWLTGSEIELVRAVEVGSDHAELELELARGPARISCATARARRDRIEARGGGGELVGRHSGGLLERAVGRLFHPGAPDSLVRLLVLELEELAVAARGGAAPTLATAADGLAVMRAIEAARSSAGDQSSWQPVAAPMP